MRSSEPEEEVGEEVVALHRWVMALVVGLVLCMHLLVMVHFWGQWKSMALITGTVLVVAPLNLLLSHRFFLLRPHSAENIRMAIGVAGTIAYGHFSHWYFPVWLLCVLDCVWSDRSPELSSQLRTYLGLVVTVAVALWDGCAPEVALGMFGLCVIIISMAKARMYVLRHTSQRLAQRRDELQHALAELELVHRRVREQERLSSLGVLAAGVAHEINNPMSYVKSNLHALQLELRSLQGLPPSLDEYLTEVIPETLEGVQRVCAIVADLRRFARGDPEALIEYDLNDEIQTALRITHGRLKTHCEVDVALEALPPMLGHPRQISQVVVNLLINAAQAMKTRGRVSISTRQAGPEEVVLTVRDTGEGMTPEVLGHLFQPFFTTRETGEGTGLGLAVVHGIVTAHGGRIQVESEPARGATFTVHLPRVPPLRFVSPPTGETPRESSPRRRHVTSGAGVSSSGRAGPSARNGAAHEPEIEPL